MTQKQIKQLELFQIEISVMKSRISEIDRNVIVVQSEAHQQWEKDDLVEESFGRPIKRLENGCVSIRVGGTQPSWVTVKLHDWIKLMEKTKKDCQDRIDEAIRAIDLL